MRHQTDNPVFDPAYLGTSGRYPARHVEICWNRSENFLVKDVEVVLVPADADKESTQWARFISWRKKWGGHLGNHSCDEWMEPTGVSPAEVFGVLLSSGFVDTLELQVALREFSAIEECDWAREMLNGFPVEEDAPDWA
ncbi:hypothetical protein F1188_13480 [Roseospira marina]|uniref:Uncharacterized protein n=1 Tax=Roseospira marina TaxID=140057 RepID=A0A5M6I9W5_9PROT|nr:hypothetical protein [Roseospira marina]KAA5605040.1 hypothetical protein F1188_13480 [Roseospira marina]MBB4314949.1 hypothetical protein [Roseospira marina]MBB5087949.1 hypothetical protein [Roseospira marina]